MKNIFVCFKDLQTGPKKLLPILKELGLNAFKSVLDENQFYDLKQDKFNSQPNATNAPKPDTTQSGKVSSKKKIESTQSAAMMQSAANEYEQKLFRIWKIELKDGVDFEKVLKILKEFDFIEYAHFANKYKLHTNDTKFGLQWYIPKIEADKAWQITQGNGNIVVAVIDSGVDYKHEDIKDNMWKNPQSGSQKDKCGYNVIKSNYDPKDQAGHGTHVAGIIGAIINNSRDTAGIAKVKIMAIKAFGGSNDEDDNMITGLYWAANRGAKIINNSWGPEERDGDFQSLDLALKYVAAKKAICVFSSGNENINIDTLFPGISENEIIIVSASETQDLKTGISNYGDKVTIVAPGESIHSLAINDANTYNMDGTSVSAPIVSAAIALLLSQSPNLTLPEIKNLLRISSDNLGRTGVNINTGRLNIYKLLLANNPALINQVMSMQTIISENLLLHPLKERNMNPDEKKFLLFQYVLINNIRPKLEEKLQNMGIQNIPSLVGRLLENISPAVVFRNHIESTEKLLWLYRDTASMYDAIDNPGNCPDGYYVCTINGQSTCCQSPMQLMMAMPTDEVEAEPVDISELLKNNLFLYWNCEISVFHAINPNMECKKVVVDEIYLRPWSGIKILDLNDIDNVNIDNIKTIHFGAPYDIFIDL